MTDYLDIYCERTAAGLWSEPLNALSNLAFFVAAAMAGRLWRAQPGLNWRNGADLLLLIGLLCAIGAGSTLWHLMPTRRTLLADTLPIAAFIAVYLIVFLVRLAGLRWPATLALFALYQAANAGIRGAFPPDFLNGSIFYGPTWAALLAMATLLAARRHCEARRFALATAVFTGALVLRTIDAAVCDVFPLGTHFLWHACNGVVLYLFAAAAIRSAGARQE